MITIPWKQFLASHSLPVTHGYHCPTTTGGPIGHINDPCSVLYRDIIFSVYYKTHIFCHWIKLNVNSFNRFSWGYIRIHIFRVVFAGKESSVGKFLWEEWKNSIAVQRLTLRQPKVFCIEYVYRFYMQGMRRIFRTPNTVPYCNGELPCAK